MGYWKQDVQSLLPTAEPTKDDILFFAGFYEGEGSCVPHKGKRGLAVVIPQKDPEMLYRLQTLWGGSVRQYRVWQWTLCGDRGRLFLQTIYPYLSHRRRGQLDKADIFVLTGKKNLSTAGMSPERAALRAAMTPQERHRDVCNRWDMANPDKRKAINIRYRERNREMLNSRHRERRRMLALSKQNPEAKESVQ